MKANTPEKIYLTEDNPSKEWYRTKQVGFNSIEYIRTDAFIKRACEYLFENYHGEKLSLRMINDFKNYMKGE